MAFQNKLEYAERTQYAKTAAFLTLCLVLLKLQVLGACDKRIPVTGLTPTKAVTC